MPPRRYQPTLNRQQEMLLPGRVDDYVSGNNTVRAIDVYVNSLDLQALDFQNTQPVISAGQPAYDPSALLKLYLYGYLQGIRSSRKLERETRRNLEAMWLAEGLQPGYKTIADFRKVNSNALKATHRDFLLLCKELSLFGGEEVAVDGSFFNANASKQGIYTDAKLEQHLACLDKRIADYQQALATRPCRRCRRQRQLGRRRTAATKARVITEPNKPKKEPCGNNLKTAVTARSPPLTRMPGYSASADKPWRATMCKSSSTPNIS